jgi:hypothetical protein
MSWDNMVTKISKVKNIVQRGIVNPQTVFPEIKKNGGSNNWQVREVAATLKNRYYQIL